MADASRKCINDVSGVKTLTPQGVLHSCAGNQLDRTMAAWRFNALARVAFERRVPERMRDRCCNGRAGFKVVNMESIDAGSMLAWVPEMPVRWNADETVGADAVRLALALDHPVYDCVYLAFAHRIGAVVVTADRRFATALAPTEHGEAVVTLADYAMAS